MAKRLTSYIGVLLCAVLSACSGRGEFGFADAHLAATEHKIWVANFRNEVRATRRSAPPRPKGISFEAMTVSVPPTHAIGQIEWPDGTPDASSDFVVTNRIAFKNLGSFSKTLARSDTSQLNETLLYVHGYNTRPAEAAYQAAQFVHDFEVTTPAVLFSWPSAGMTAGYVYDRDSALLARDKLEDTLISLTQQGRKVSLIGHSMGGYLIMETLRQMAQKGSLDIARKIDALVLLSPDIDGELFRDQALAVGDLPDPFILMVAEQDRALRISSLLTGRRPRLGAQTDRSIVGDLPITVIDISDLAVGGSFDHKIATTSPAAIAIIRKLSRQTRRGEVNIGAQVVLSQVQL